MTGSSCGTGWAGRGLTNSPSQHHPTRQRAQLERAAVLIEQQARAIDTHINVYRDLCAETLELRAQLEAVKAVLDPLWGVA